MPITGEITLSAPSQRKIQKEYRWE